MHLFPIPEKDFSTTINLLHNDFSRRTGKWIHTIPVRAPLCPRPSQRSWGEEGFSGAGSVLQDPERGCSSGTMWANHWGRKSNLSPPCTRKLCARRGMRAHQERRSALLGGLGEKGAQEGFRILRPAGGASDPSCLPLLDRQGHTERLVTFFAMKFIKRHPPALHLRQCLPPRQATRRHRSSPCTMRPRGACESGA